MIVIECERTDCHGQLCEQTLSLVEPIGLEVDLYAQNGESLSPASVSSVLCLLIDVMHI